MIPVSNDFEESLSSDVQVVRPDVKAWLSDARTLDNLKVYTSSHTLRKQIEDRSPLMHLKLDKTEFDSIKKYSSTLVVSFGSPAVFNNTHPLTVGTAVYVVERTVITSIAVGTTYYVQDPVGNTFKLNNDRTNALNNSVTGRVNFTGSVNGTAKFIFSLDGVLDYGSEKLTFAHGSSTTGAYPAGYLRPRHYEMTNKAKEIIEPKLLIHSFSINDSNSLGYFTDLTDSDPELHYYSLRFSSGTQWYASGGSAYWYNSSERYNTVPVYFYMDSKCLDHFVDFRIGSSGFDGGLGAIVRYIDSRNYIYCRQTRSGGGTSTGTMAICKVVNNVHTTVIAIDNEHYYTDRFYRLEAKYNTFTLYDMGGSVPDETDEGTVVSYGGVSLTCYIDDAIFRGSDATGVGLLNASTAGYNPGYTPGGATFSFTHFATYGFNYLVGGEYFANSIYTMADVTHLGNSIEQFTDINNASDFTYSFLMKTPGGGTEASQTIFWLGDSSGNTAARISYNRAASRLKVQMVDTSNVTYTLNASASFVNNQFYNIQVVKNNSVISIYIDGVLNSSSDTLSDFTLKNVSATSPIIMIGGDFAGTAFGDAAGMHKFGGYISEFAAYDFAFTQDDVDSLFYCIDNNAVLYADTTDYYCNAECAVDGQLEETLTFAFTNMLSSSGEEIRASNGVYVPDGTEAINIESNIEDNYGWMSRVESNASGSFVNPDFISLSFDAVNCNKLMLSTGYMMGRIDDFNYTITKSDNTQITGSSTFGGESIVLIDLAETYEIVSLRVEPTTTVNPYDYARLFTVNPIWEVDLSDYIISFNVDKVRENFDASLPIGATAANSASISLDNTSKDFNMFGNSLYGKYTVPDVRFFISTTHEILKYGSQENLVIAEDMYADTWSFDNSSMTVEVSLRDYSKYLQEKTLPGYVGQGMTAGRGISEMMMISGFPRRKISYINRYEDEVFFDDPYIYVPFNFTESDLAYGSGLLTTVDECARVSLVESFIAQSGIGQNLVYSETISTQDDIKRQNDLGLVSTFEPAYNNRSFKPGFSLFYDISGVNPVDIFGDQSESWTIEFLHYADPQFSHSGYFAIFSTEAADYFQISYAATETDVRYRLTMSSTAGPDKVIYSDWIDRGSPCQIAIRKTAGATIKYDLFVNGILFSSVTSTDTENTVGRQFSLIDATGYVSHFAMFKKALSNERILSHFISSAVSLMPVYRYIYASDQTYWDAMLSIATADLGMFYFDEYGYFRYEYRDMLHQSFINRYQTSQHTFSDEYNIISGQYISEIQTNKVIVSVSGASAKSTEDEVIWQAPTGESLAVTTLMQDMDLYSTSALAYSTSDPQWADSGYIKIDDEIMRYTSLRGNYFYGLQRGLFGTQVNRHSEGSKIREAKDYQIAYTSAPAVAVKYPLITNTNVDVDYYASNAYESRIILSLNGTPVSGTIEMLEGKDPVDKVDQFFEIVGVGLATVSSGELITSIDSEIQSNVRKYGIKELKIDNPYIQNKLYAKIVADHIIGYYKEPVRVLDMDALAVPHLQLGDLITIEKFVDLGLENKTFWVIGNSISYDGSISQSLSLLSYTATIDPPEFTFTGALSRADWFLTTYG